MSKTINLGHDGGANLRKYIYEQKKYDVDFVVDKIATNKKDQANKKRLLYRWFATTGELKVRKEIFKKVLSAVGCYNLSDYPYLSNSLKNGALKEKNEILGQWWMYFFFRGKIIEVELTIEKEKVTLLISSAKKLKGSSLELGYSQYCWNLFVDNTKEVMSLSGKYHEEVELIYGMHLTTFYGEVFSGFWFAQRDKIVQEERKSIFKNMKNTYMKSESSLW
jgi:hypothetical protein